MASKLLLIRHAETEAAGRGLFVGSTDVEATGAGLERLDRLKSVLEGYRCDAWYASPMTRAIQTTRRLLGRDGDAAEYIVDERLREIDFGRWEMKGFAEISAADPGLVDSWAAYDTFVFPEGEAVADFQSRVEDVFSALQRLPCREVVVVTHGGVIRTMVCLALGLNAENYLLFNVRPGTLTVLDLYQGSGGILSGLGIGN